MSPSARTKPTKNSTLTKLSEWCRHAGLEEWDFHNVIPDVVNGSDRSQVNSTALMSAVAGRSKVVALGGFASSACRRHKIQHLKIDHPSPRNRNLNDKRYEAEMLDRFRRYLHGAD